MRLGLEKKNKNNNKIIIKAASSNERALAPGLTANGGFRKSMNGEQYAFQVINTGGICQSIYICQTSCCQLVAL